MVVQCGQEGAQRRALESDKLPIGRASANSLAGLSSLARYSQARVPLGQTAFIPKVSFQPKSLGEELPLSSHAAAAQFALPQQSWLPDFLREIEDLPKIAAENEFAAPTSEALKQAEMIGRLCSSRGTVEPTLDVREDGEVELFYREGSRGLWLILHSDNRLQVYGDFGGDQWQAKYRLDGAIWSTHLMSYLGSLGI